MLATQIASDDERSEIERLSGGWSVMMPIMSATSAVVLATYATAKSMIIVRSMRSHRALALVSATAAIGTRIASAATRDTHTRITVTWRGNTASKPSTTRIASAGGQRDSSRMGWVRAFMDASRSERPDDPCPYRHIRWD